MQSKPLTEKEIIVEAVKKAEKNGYKFSDMGYYDKGFTRLSLMDYNQETETFEDNDYYDGLISYISVYKIIFSHDFAKKFFGEREIDHMISDDDIQMGNFGFEWEFHLKEMILAKDRIRYLEKFL